MNYEIVNLIKTDAKEWLKIKQRQQTGQIIMLAPNASIDLVATNENVRAITFLDLITKRTFNSANSLFFNQVPTVTGAQVYMNSNGTIEILTDGTVIGAVQLYPNTRRLVKQVIYYNQDQTTDFIEEYTFDGQLYSNMFYQQGEINEIVFYDACQRPKVRYHFYQQAINLVSLIDSNTGAVITTYDSVSAFIKAELAKIVTKNDRININYLGIELSVLEDTKSFNTLYLNESPFDEQGIVKANLAAILLNKIKYIQQVVLQNQADLVKLKATGLPTTKLKFGEA